MSELSVAEHALCNGDVIAAEECLVAGAACGLGTGVNGAANGFAGGCIESIKADGAGHICSFVLVEWLVVRKYLKRMNQFF
jgi:hypothetical protein